MNENWEDLSENSSIQLDDLSVILLIEDYFIQELSENERWVCSKYLLGWIIASRELCCVQYKTSSHCLKATTKRKITIINTKNHQ